MARNRAVRCEYMHFGSQDGRPFGAHKRGFVSYEIAIENSVGWFTVAGSGRDDGGVAGIPRAFGGSRDRAPKHARRRHAAGKGRNKCVRRCSQTRRTRARGHNSERTGGAVWYGRSGRYNRADVRRGSGTATTGRHRAGKARQRA